MKRTRIFTFAAVALVVAPLALAADFGVRAGRYNDGGDDFVGIEMLFDAGTININPNIEYALIDDVTAGSANVDVTVDILRLATVVPYIGAGVGIAYVDEGGANTTDVVGNLIGGASFEAGRLRPYAQVKYFRRLEDDSARGGARDELAIAVGLRF